MKAAKALSEGRTGEAIAELDKLGWIKEVADEDRYKQLADCIPFSRRRKEARRHRRNRHSS